MSSFCHLAIISPQHSLNSVGERGKTQCNHLLISASLRCLEFHFIILFCVCMSNAAFNKVYGIFLDFKISYKICFYTTKSFFIIHKQEACFKLYPLRFSISNLRQNDASPNECPLGTHFVFMSQNFLSNSAVPPLNFHKTTPTLHTTVCYIITYVLDIIMWQQQCLCMKPPSLKQGNSVSVNITYPFSI